jgi:UDP-N-acetylmuramoyl-tripeptide--D-alanyl-D-alanine ligase
MFTINEILEASKGTLVQGPARGRVCRVCIDSRIVKKGELFIAIKGEVFDGHDFIDAVFAKGVRVLIVHKPVKIKDPKISVIRVEDTIRALGDIARFHRLRFKIPVIALTGSAGKTTTKEMIAAVLGRKYKVLKNEGTQNNHIGVPLTLLKLKTGHRIVVLECGTNQPGDIVWLADVARPSLAVFTNIGESHLEKLKTVSGVFKEKWTLTSFMGAQDTVIINAEDAFLSQQIRKKNIFKIMTYGIRPEADWKASDINIVSGRYLNFQVYNALAAVCCGVFLKVPRKDIIQALQSFEFLQGRGQNVRLGKGWLINDTYNANPVSMRAALQTLQAIETRSKRIFVAADMLELGSQSRALHQAMGRAIGTAGPAIGGPHAGHSQELGSGIDILITVGRLARLMGPAARRLNKKMQIFACRDVESAQKCLAKVFHNGDAVLIKGSRRMRMEQVVEFLLASPKGSG